MRDYAKISPTFWTGETGKNIRALGVEAQLLALYLLTNPHANMFGLYYLPLPLINHETGLSAKRIATLILKLQSIGFCRFDVTTEFVWVAEMAGYQIGVLDPKDYKLKSLQKSWRQLPNNPFIGPFFEKYGERYSLDRRASKGLYMPLPSPQILEQEQEQETEQEQDLVRKKGIAKPDSPETPKPPKQLTDVQKVVTVFKLASGHNKDDPAWDKTYFPRYAKTAKQLIDYLGSWQDASDCIEDVYGKFSSKGLTVTIETVMKHAADWKRDKSEQMGRRNGGVLPVSSHGGGKVIARAIGPPP